VETLEPTAPDAFFAWNFFDGILSQKEYYSDYVFEDVAADLLRNDAALRKVFLAALTGYASSEDQQRAAEAGFARHLAKPASLQMLEEVITSLPS